MSDDRHRIVKLEELLAKLVRALKVEKEGLSGDWGHPYLSTVLDEIAAELPAPPSPGESNVRPLAGPGKVE